MGRSRDLRSYRSSSATTLLPDNAVARHHSYPASLAADNGVASRREGQKELAADCREHERGDSIEQGTEVAEDGTAMATPMERANEMESRAAKKRWRD